MRHSNIKYVSIAKLPKARSTEILPNLDVAFANTFAAAAVDAACAASTAFAVAMNRSRSNEDVFAKLVSISYNAIAASSA